MEEIKMQLRLQHKNLLPLTAVFVADFKCVFTMPLACGDLFTLLSQAPDDGHALTVSEVRDYAMEILEGIAFMHSNMICHRDIKCENILWFEEEVAYLLSNEFSEFFFQEGRTMRICDFGESVVYEDEEAMSDVVGLLTFLHLKSFSP